METVAQYFGSFGTSKSEALATLMPAVDAILEAHQKGDYDAFLAQITPDLADKISRQGFENAHKEASAELGQLVGKSFLGSLKDKGNPRLLFVATYAGCPSEVLISITFANGSQPPKASWVWVE